MEQAEHFPQATAQECTASYEPHIELDRQKWHRPKAAGNQLLPSLSWLELAFYFIAFWSGCGYSLYRFYRTSQRWGQYLHVTPVGDSLLGWRQDQTDVEWFVWVPLLTTYAPIALLHLVLAQLVRKYCPQHLCVFYVGFSVCVSVGLIGSCGTGLCVAVPFLMFSVLLTRLKLLVWLTWCFTLVLLNTPLFSTYLEVWLKEVPDGDYKVSVMAAWIILRSLSFCLEVCDTDPEGHLPPLPLLLTLLGYCLYLPFLCTGPYMPFTDFRVGLCEPYRAWTVQRVVWVILQLLRFLWWTAFTHFLLYHFYAHSLHFAPELVKKLSSWSMAGFVYFLTAFLMLKYVVLYGLPSVAARVEGYDPPRHPRCTLMTYRFSDIWRYFDHGLYRFMLKHIYIPWVGREAGLVGQVQGTALVFTFVYVWHGVSSQVFWWAFINFLGVTVEKLADAASRLPTYQHWQGRWLPGRWGRRWYGVLAVSLYVPSLTALVIFLSNIDNAVIVANRVFVTGFPQCTLATFFFMFCLGQICMELQNWRIQLKEKQKIHVS